MNKAWKLKLTDHNWSYGSYLRREYKKDMLYTFFQYKEFLVMYNMATGRMTMKDQMAEQMLSDQVIAKDRKTEYESHICDKFAFRYIDRHDDIYIDQVYGEIQQERKRWLGIENIEKEQHLRVKRKCNFDIGDGINQSVKRDELIRSCKSVMMIITQAELFFLMGRDIEEIRKSGKEVYIVVDQERGNDTPAKGQIEQWIDADDGIFFITMDNGGRGVNFEGIEYDEILQNQIEQGETCLFVYGEDGLLQCKNLNVDAIVYGIPSGYYTKALTNQHGIERACIVYVPKHFNVMNWVGLTERTRITYWHLFKLWEDFGDEIYEVSPEGLYVKYPQYFINIYASNDEFLETKPGYPIQIQLPEEESFENPALIMKKYDQLKDKAVKEYLNSLENIRYYSTYFNEHMKEVEIPWYEEEQQNGVLVQAIRMKKAENSYVRQSFGNTTLRELIKDVKSEGFPLRIYSNFLFFLTPKLAQLYNDLRNDRLREQLDFDRGHLDYMLYYEDGKRIESFPLFRKACIAMTESGHFLFFNYELGGGTVTINDKRIVWDKNNIDMEVVDSNTSICIYTPKFAKDHSIEDVTDYRMLVGGDRVNFVIIQNKLKCVRKGSVVLSPIGVVLSLEKTKGEQWIEEQGLSPLKDGYYDCGNLDLTVKLEHPDEIGKEQWEQVVWSYGGGMSLILEGKGLCDGDSMEEWLLNEGWMLPLSRQTQESAVEKMAKHPRTAIGITRDGDLVIIVYSGRTKMAVGADYNEMCQIARKLFPDIRSLMNVDGGGSAMLGIAFGNSFMELSYPATSFESCAGMVRPVNTVLCLEQ